MSRIQFICKLYRYWERGLITYNELIVLMRTTK